MRLVTILALALAGLGCGPTSSSTDGGNNNGVPDAMVTLCTSGVTRCEGTTLQVCQGGTFTDQEQCTNECVDGLGCVFCRPGTGTCSGDMATECRADGSGYDDISCDPLLGLSCQSGRCVGECTPQNLGNSYIGCEYYPTVTGTGVHNRWNFSVAISNTSNTPASVHIEGGALAAPTTFTVAANSLVVQNLPWVAVLKGCNTAPTAGGIECTALQETSAVVAKGAYHLRSDRPVTVYQFSPVEFTNGQPCVPIAGLQNCTFINDASLLLPVNSMRGDYVVASYAAWSFGGGSLPSELAVTATQDQTAVTFTTSVATQSGATLPGFVAGAPQTIMLNAGDVAQVFALSGDLTGSFVSSDKPVQVIGAHFCTQLPHGVNACDHLEESMFPIETLDTEYLVAPAAMPALPNGKVRSVRVVATEANTTLTYDPPQAGLLATLSSPGDFTTVANNTASFGISSDKKILVVEYMQGEDSGGNLGDPAMVLAVPVGQYRSDYQFHAPQNYTTLYVNIIAPDGTSVSVDGVVVTGYSTIGTTGYSVAKFPLEKNGTGTYRVTGDQPFGITVYGYGSFTSFWYPGGLDLDEIIVD